MIGRTISHYKILERIGGGGMGVVYKAEDTKLKRSVALKFLPPAFATDPTTKERFIHEAQSASALDHTNICNIYEIDESEDGQLFISMAYYAGETLKLKIEKGKLKIEEAIDYTLQIAQGLQKAHEKGIIHRDVKPANIIITNDGEAKILDFGLAKFRGQTKITKSGSTVGTVAYMSPEQARGDEVDHRTDIWSLGVMLYEMVTGELPFKGEYDQAVIFSILNDDQEPILNVLAGVPIKFERIVNKALTKHSDDRYQHIDDLNVDLKSLRNYLEEENDSPDFEQKNKEGKRILAAIMFSDMVGYSAIAQKDESLAIDLLEEHRKILRSIFPKHNGHEVETAGDSFFVEFSSAVEAVNCAVEIQKTLFSHNKSVSEEKQINIRIGVHLSDVVHKGSNILGDGVNIAARIEPLAQSGGICISQDVVRQIQNKIDFPFIKLETTNLKNIKLPVDIFTIVLPWLEKKSYPKSSKKRKKLFSWSVILISIIFLTVAGYYIQNLIILTDKPESKTMPGIQWENSIAILPFEDLSQEGNQEWFCDGMTEQIISNLAKLPRLKVISRTSVMKYKDSEKTIPEIGKELNVAYILEGSMLKFENRIRVTAQLINTKDDFHVWSEDFDKEYKELFNLQDDVSEAIARNLLHRLSGNEVREVKMKRPKNTEAYEYYMKGIHFHIDKYSGATRSMDDFNTSELMLKKAIEHDPNYAPSYAALADLYNSYYNNEAQNEDEKKKYLDLQEKYIETAYNLDQNSAEVYRVMGYVQEAKGELKKAYENYKKAIMIQPNWWESHHSLADFYNSRGLYHLAIKYHTKAIELNPLYPSSYVRRSICFSYIGELEKAEIDLQKALEINPDHRTATGYYGYILILLEKYDEVEVLITKREKIHPNSSSNPLLRACLSAAKGERVKLPEINFSAFYKSRLYLLLKMREEVIQFLNEDFEILKKSERSRYLWLKNQPLHDFLRSDTRFQELLAKHKEIYEENLEKYGDIDI